MLLFPGGVEGWPHNVHALTSGAEEPVGRFPPVPVAKETWRCRTVRCRVFLLFLRLHAVHDFVFGVKCSNTVSRQPNKHQNWSVKGTHTIDWLCWNNKVLLRTVVWLMGIVWLFKADLLIFYELVRISFVLLYNDTHSCLIQVSFNYFSCGS